MIESLKNNTGFYLVCLLWAFLGAMSGMMATVLIPVSLILLLMNKRYPEILIGFLFILILSDNLETATSFAKNFKNIYILFLTAVLVMENKLFQPANKLFSYFIPYFLIAIICMAWSPVLIVSAQKTLSYILLFICVPNYIRLNYKLLGEEFFKNLLMFMLVIGVVGFLWKYIDYEVAVSHGGRLRGIFGNPNGLGIFLILMTIMYAVINEYFPSLFTRREKILIFIIIFYLVIATGSRTALLTVIFFFCFIFVYRVSTFLGFITFISMLVLSEFIINNYGLLIRALGLEESFRVETLEAGSGRFIVWTFVWDYIQESVFIGKGFAYDEYLTRSNARYLSKLGHEGGVHNTYLIIWLNTGLIGLLAFLRGFILLFVKAAKNTPLAIPAMYAVMFSVNFEPWLAASLNPFTILFLIIITIMTDEIFQKSAETESDNSNSPEKNEKAAL